MHFRTTAAPHGSASGSGERWQAAGAVQVFPLERIQPGIVELGVKSVKAMKEGNKEGAPSASTAGLPQRLFRWLDKRTGVDGLMKESLDEPIPGGARLAYVFGSGLIFIFI